MSETHEEAGLECVSAIVRTLNTFPKALVRKVLFSVRCYWVVLEPSGGVAWGRKLGHGEYVLEGDIGLSLVSLLASNC